MNALAGKLTASSLSDLQYTCTRPTRFILLIDDMGVAPRRPPADDQSIDLGVSACVMYARKFAYLFDVSLQRLFSGYFIRTILT